MRRWLWLIAPLLVVTLASLTIACDDEEEVAPAGETPVAGESPAAEAGRLVADIQPAFDGSTASGTAVLTETADGTTEVEVEMTGLPEGAHANHLHHGTCPPDTQGEIHVTLEVLEAGADGTASATTTDFQETDPDPEFSHFAQGHYVAVHAGGGEVIGCGDVVAE